MAGTSIIDQERAFGRKEDPAEQFSTLSTKFDDLLNYLKGDDIGGASGSPLQLGRSAIKDIKKGITQYRKEELPDLFNRFITDVTAGRLTPGQASSAYEDAARSANQIAGTTKRAGQLANLTAGMPSAEKYQRYLAPMQLASQQLTGKALSDEESKNYIAALQGMGVSPENPSDVMGTFGKMFTTSRGYRENEVVFRPEVVSKAIPELNRAGTAAFAQMLG
jgi:hypothetical protein